MVIGALSTNVGFVDQAGHLPAYLDDTFLHLDLGYAGKFQKSLHDVVVDGLPVDIALLAGGMVFGVAIGVATGLASATSHRARVDRALNLAGDALSSLNPF